MNVGSGRQQERGSALAISLLMIVLITILVLAVTAQTQLERQLSAAHFAELQARTFAQIGLDAALARIRETLAPFDDPFGTTTPPDHFWSLSPGRIDLFDFTPNAAGRPNRAGTVALHSGYPLASTNDAANLNASDSYGRRPIWSENRKMEVDWIPVGRNPAEALSATNPLAGRFAFWVDDEGSKINVNTADGSDNYSLSSYGQGTPTAVSLSVFAELGDTNAPDRETVRAIAAEARRQPFATIAEMATRELSLTHPVTGEVSEKTVPPKFPATNSFNLTTYSRSPDFNLFNLPKFQLIPSNVDSLSQLAGAANFIAINRMIQYAANGSFYGTATNAAQSALRSLYPTPRQLSGNWTNVWPLMPNFPNLDGGVQLVAGQLKAGGNFSLNQTARFAAMRQMAWYLVGTNALGQPIRWPFRDANYLEKYKNLRQIDSIALQIFEMPRNAAMRYFRPGYFDEAYNLDFLVNPGILPYGLLGDQPVGSAVGRYPRLTRIWIKAQLSTRNEAFPKTGPSTFYPGVQTNASGNPIEGTGYYDGANLIMNVGFSQYLPRHLYDSDNVVDGKQLDYGLWQVESSASHLGWSGTGGMNETDGSGNTASALNPASSWMDTLLYAEADFGSGFVPGNSSGIDFRANRSNWPDPDPRASDFRRAEYRVVTQLPATNSVGIYTTWGTGFHPYVTCPLLRFIPFGPSATYGPFSGVSQNFSQNFAGNGVVTSVPGGALNKVFPTRNDTNMPGYIQAIRLRGGVTLQIGSQSRMALTPIDAILGPLNTAWSSRVVTNSPAVLTNLTKAVVPIFKGSGLELAVGQTKYVVAKLRDPLVGQLPGDWLVNHFTNSPTTNETSFVAGFATWPANDANANATQFDYLPEPEWVDMAAESGAVGLLANYSQSTPSIFLPYVEGTTQRIQIGGPNAWNTFVNLSRQKSFPSVGHLQYVRTGAMPDNENAQIGDADYAGMPFRCLNFGPENTQGGIPDWALLDLFTVPNAIWTKPSSRFAYPTVGSGGRPELIQLTYGGASTGKINLNGSVLWPWASDDAGYVRPLPLAAQFNGLRYNRDGKVYRSMATKPRVVTSTNSWQVLAAPAASSLAEAIAAYIRTNGPLALSGQMCDIPALNAYGAQIPTTLNGESLLPPNTGFYGRGLSSPDGFNRTRNDLVSQSIGNLVTQGNVFAVWVAAQSVRKSPASDPAVFQPEKGDRVAAQVRLRFLVERKLDPGVDGVYGNVTPGRAGQDGIIGTPDDLSDLNNPNDQLNHPRNPKFIYQIVNVQEIQ